MAYWAWSILMLGVGAYFIISDEDKTGRWLLDIMPLWGERVWGLLLVVSGLWFLFTGANRFIKLEGDVIKVRDGLKTEQVRIDEIQGIDGSWGGPYLDGSFAILRTKAGQDIWLRRGTFRGRQIQEILAQICLAKPGTPITRSAKGWIPGEVRREVPHGGN